MVLGHEVAEPDGIAGLERRRLGRGRERDADELEVLEKRMPRKRVDELDRLPSVRMISGWTRRTFNEARCGTMTIALTSMTRALSGGDTPYCRGQLSLRARRRTSQAATGVRRSAERMKVERMLRGRTNVGSSSLTSSLET